MSKLANILNIEFFRLEAFSIDRTLGFQMKLSSFTEASLEFIPQGETATKSCCTK